MESERAKKSRSIGSESKSSRQSKSQRPDVGERVKSAPSLDRRRASDAKQSTRVSRTSTTSDRASKTSSRDGVSSRSYGSPSASHQSSRPTSEQLLPTNPRNSSRAHEPPQFFIAVLAAPGAGKTTFIQKCLDLKKPPTSPVSSTKVSFEDVVYRVQLVEFSFDDLEFGNGRRVAWPKYVNTDLLPRIDGVLCLYDVTDQESIAMIPPLLGALSNSNVPCVLVSCKWDQPLLDRQVDSAFDAKIKTSFPLVELGPNPATAPDSQKRCILSILKMILANTKEISRQTSPQAIRPRAATTQDKVSTGNNNLSDQLAAHNRSKSDLPRSQSREPRNVPAADFFSDTNLSDIEDDPKSPASKALVIDTRRATTHSSGSRTPMNSSGFLNELVSGSDDQTSEEPATPDSLFMTTVPRPGTAETADSQIHNTFLNMSEESQDESPESLEDEELSKIAKLKIPDESKPEMGVSFDDLVDRLLKLPSTNRESKFVPVFLSLYRAFATPAQLVAAIIKRFENVEKSKVVQFNKAAEQLRYLQILGKWTADYPGDFCGSAVRGLAISFVGRISKNRNFAGAAKEISNNMIVNTMDTDFEWAYTELGAATKSVTTSSSNSTTKKSPQKGVKPSRPAILEDDSDDDSDSSIEGHDLDSSPRHSGAPSTASSLARTANTSSQSLANLLNLEQARTNAERLRPIPRIPLCKLQWHQFMDTPPADFAIEVTRTDWTMYTAIRPRDFIRHVCLSSERRRKSTHPDNIGLMVKQFNHLALFVSGMILLREKPKHRAKALEKFMTVAWKVRQMNNYNALGAIVAGITGPEIHRLAQTRDLVPAPVQKDFLRLTILMSHSRSHSAYRMAWENSFAERIPFLPLVRQDLTRAHSGNHTFVGPNKDLIHWRKFEIMGDVILGIQKSQDQAYVFPERNAEITKLILETKVLEGSEESADPRDELQKRSEQLEPASGMADASRKKFDWFRR